MHVVILAYTFETYATIRIADRLTSGGHSVEIISPLDCILDFNSSRSCLWHQGKVVSEADVAILRGLTYVDNGVLVPRTLEATIASHFLHRGAICINNPDAKLNATNKLVTGQILSQAGIPVPRTILIWNTTHIDHILAELGAPMIFKSFDGFGGIGVIRCDSIESARSTFDALRMTGHAYLAQEYVAESRGQDIRVLVLGGKVLGGIRCSARSSDFRSNAARGAVASKVQLTPEIENLALSAVSALRMELAGVDILESERGFLVLEVNPTPGLEMFDAVSGGNAAAEIVTYLEKVSQGKGA